VSSEPGIPVASLYVHVPFCARKCGYCAFYSEASNGETIERYLAALEREFELVAGDLRPTTIYFGGGTPSLLNRRQWERVFATMQRLGLSGADEWSIECNPATVSLDKARLWRDRGVNRVSLGIQSLDDDLLDRLGRVHTRELAFKAYDLLRRAGFDNVGIDLMFAIPGQPLRMWQDTLREALALGSEHLSCYEVIYEEDTPLFAQLRAGRFEVDEDLACVMYDALLAAAAGHGFEQYEVANFARHIRLPRPARTAAVITGGAPAAVEPRVPAFACRHNVNYWRGGAYFGLGPSAASYLQGIRTKNWSNTILYCEQLEGGRRAIESRDELEPLQRAGEIAGFGLRMNTGWRFDEFQTATGFDLRQAWQREMEDLVERGWAHRGADHFRLTRQGMRFADAALAMFLR
jgi:oxygen-independent coproporphyrinogen III oxidase